MIGLSRRVSLRRDAMPTLLAILKGLPWGVDKSLHFLSALPLGIGIGLLTRPWFPATGSWVAAILAGALVGIAKECGDHRKNQQAAKQGKPAPHSVEALDAVATMLGALVGGLVAFLR